MWRNKKKDLWMLANYRASLLGFKRLKDEKWEDIDERYHRQVPMSDAGEDWDPVCDEGAVEEVLEYDPDYANIRDQLLLNLKNVKEIAEFLNVDIHHHLDWVKFRTPLLSNPCIDDSVEAVNEILDACEHRSYLVANAKSLVK